jgi:hypothetical protein
LRVDNRSEFKEQVPVDISAHCIAGRCSKKILKSIPSKTAMPGMTPTRMPTRKPLAGNTLRRPENLLNEHQSFLCSVVHARVVHQVVQQAAQQVVQQVA